MIKIQQEKTNPDVVVATLDAYREVLSGYQIADTLTHDFRVKVEPKLGEVWNKQDLAQYSYTVWTFGQQMRTALLAWAQRYCAKARARRSRCRVRS